MALTDKLTAIGDAIRAKTGGTELLTLDAMPTEIASIETGGGGDITVEPIVLSGACNYMCGGKIASAYIDLFGDTVSTMAVTGASYMFQYFTGESIPFDINFNGTHTQYDVGDMFIGCNNLKTLPKLNNIQLGAITSMFEGCYNLRTIPEDWANDIVWTYVNSNKYCSCSEVFYNCYSLRKIPTNILNNLWGIQTSSYNHPYNGTFNGCYALGELEGVPVCTGTLTSNVMSGMVDNCNRLKEFTFATNEDGSAKTANWQKQTLDLSNYVGYAQYASNITKYNSGLDDTTYVSSATQYDLRKDKEWWTDKLACSRYTLESAINTINSLPDCSAYLASSGGTANTIKFKQYAGGTSGTQINNITEAQIAVATAKGWTVTLV